MCGIIGYVGKKHNSLNVLINGLKNLEYRGYDSAGIAFINNNKINIIKEKGIIENLEKHINFEIHSNIGIGHTRWATHGEPSKINSHPHRVGKITIVHNGIIDNYHELKTILKEYGYKFKSNTDTEIACALIDKLYNEKNDMVKVLDKCKNLLRGSYALGIIIDDEPNTIYAVKKDSPLIIGIDNNDFYIASDVPAILNYTNKYILLDDNNIAKINDTLSIYGSNGKILDKKVQTFNWNIEAAQKNGFEHFMLKEIHEQPKVLHDTFQSFMYKGLSSLDNELLDFSKYNQITIVACGSAYHTGLVGKHLIEKYTSIPVIVEVASEYRYKKIFKNSKNLVIVISQSGETADTLAALRIAKENNMNTLAIVNTVGSSIAREANHVVYTKAGIEISVATTKAYSAQIAMLILITLKIIIDKKIENDLDIDEIIKEMFTIKNTLEELLDNINVSKLAKTIYQKNHLFFIGRGIDYALSLEGSLKLKEISYIHSEAYPSGELKHGTMSLIEKDTPVIAIATDEYIYEKTISNIKEVKARGAKVIFITTSELFKKSDFYDEVITIPTTHSMLQSLITIIPLQLIAYEVAKLRGCDIDKPRNLAKSVTVE